MEPSDTRIGVFYSISNCQVGLRGVSFGSFLIKQVVDELASELPNIKSFVTLSPLPGFVNWLQTVGIESLGAREKQSRGRLAALFQDHQRSAHVPLPDEDRSLLLTLAARYLLHARNDRGEPHDPVARFHLGNGARIQRLVCAADPSARGLAQSQGIMVSYEYLASQLEINHEAYANEGRIVATDTIIRTASKDMT